MEEITNGNLRLGSLVSPHADPTGYHRLAGGYLKLDTAACTGKQCCNATTAAIKLGRETLIDRSLTIMDRHQGFMLENASGLLRSSLCAGVLAAECLVAGAGGELRMGACSSPGARGWFGLL